MESFCEKVPVNPSMPLKRCPWFPESETSLRDLLRGKPQTAGRFEIRANRAFGGVAANVRKLTVPYIWPAKDMPFRTRFCEFPQRPPGSKDGAIKFQNPERWRIFLKKVFVKISTLQASEH
jgi:hypothetical protein